MKSLDPETLAESLRYVSGNFDPDKLSLFAPVRDEMYFLPSFLKHYRSIGIEQFLFFDDGSVDGTTAFLSGQPDCVVLNLPFKYGEEVRFTPAAQKPFKKRIGTILKNEIPNLLLKNKYVLYLDADEFLFLPPGVGSVRTVIERLQAAGDTSVCASVTEFFPRNISDIESNFRPQSLAGLLEEYPYFDATRILELRENDHPIRIGESKTGTLVREYPPAARKNPVRDFFGIPQKSPEIGGFPRMKTPIVLHNETSFRCGSHKVSLPPSCDILLTVGHFVFTSNLDSKIQRALEWKSHRGKGKKYRQFQSLLHTMKQSNATFLGTESVKFENTSQFLDHKLMKW